MLGVDTKDHTDFAEDQLKGLWGGVVDFVTPSGWKRWGKEVAEAYNEGDHAEAGVFFGVRLGFALRAVRDFLPTRGKAGPGSAKQGTQWEAKAVEQWSRTNKLTDVRDQVLIRPLTNEGKPHHMAFRIDRMGREPRTGTLRYLDAKLRAQTKPSSSQKECWPMFERNGGIVRSSGKSPYRIGRKLDPAPIERINKPDPWRLKPRLPGVLPSKDKRESDD
jgi:hypothetical protein